MGDVRLALRSLVKSPGFTGAAVLTLGLGIGAATSVWSVVYGILLRPLPYHEPASLVLMEGTRRFAGEPRRETFSARDITEWQRADSLASLAGYADVGRSLDTRDGLEPVTNTLVSETFFSTLGTPPAAGRLPGAGMKPLPVAVISRPVCGSACSTAGRTRSGGRSGWAIATTRSSAWPPPASGTRATAWTSGRRWARRRREGSRRSSPGPAAEASRSWQGSGQDVSVDEVRAELQVHAQQPGGRARRDARGAGTRRHHAGRRVAARRLSARRCGLFLGATGLLLLVAVVANVANLTIARQVARARGLAVRLALGASRGRLLADVAAEGVLIGATGGLAGLLLAAAAVRTLVWWAPPQLPRLDAVRLDAPVLAFAAAAGLLTTLLAALVPAVHAARQDAARALGTGVRSAGATGAARGRALLVGAELAVCIVLLVGTAVLTRSFVRLLQVDVGARTDDVLVARLDLSLGRTLDEPHQRALGAALVARSRALPGVVEAAIGTSLPPNGQMVQADAQGPRVRSRGHPGVRGDRGPGEPRLLHGARDPAPRGPCLRGSRRHDARARARRQRRRGAGPVRRTSARAHAHAAHAATRKRDGDRGRRRRQCPVRRPRGADAADALRALRAAARPTAFLLVRTAGSPGAVAASLRQAVAAVDRRIGVVSIRTLDDVLAQETAQPAFRTAVRGRRPVRAL